MIDFDDCATYWFVADIAFALRDLFGDSASQVDFQNAMLLRFIEGYRSARSIDQTSSNLGPAHVYADGVRFGHVALP